MAFKTDAMARHLFFGVYNRDSKFFPNALAFTLNSR